jgi:hypothetical protein
LCSAIIVLSVVLFLNLFAMKKLNNSIAQGYKGLTKIPQVVHNGKIHISSSPSGPSHEYFIRQNLENSGMGGLDIKQIDLR